MGIAVFAAPACSDDRTGDDAGNNPPADSGVTADSGQPDSGDAPDSGEQPDTGAGPSCPAVGVIADPNPPQTEDCTALGPELQAGTAPERRGDMASAIDKRCGRAIIFYGDRAEPVQCGPVASQFLSDGYAFDLDTGVWTEIEVQGGNAPLRRARAAAAWDETSNRFIMFGGRYRPGTSGAYTFLKDLWAFDPSTRTWEELSPQNSPNGPGGRMNSAIAIDHANNRVLVFGGGQISADFMSFVVDSQTWAFDLGTRMWSQIGSNSPPPPRLFHAVTFDRMRERFYVFGGGGPNSFSDASEFYNDVWYLDLAMDRWVRAANNTGPDARIRPEIEYDAARDQLVMFAGHDNTDTGLRNDLWTFNLETFEWSEIKAGDTLNQPQRGFCDFPGNFTTPDLCSPERREAHTFEIFGNRAFMFGGRTDCGLASDTWLLRLDTMEWSRVVNSFTGMTCYRLGLSAVECEAPDSRICG